jgi:hypothetical protein
MPLSGLLSLRRAPKFSRRAGGKQERNDRVFAAPDDTPFEGGLSDIRDMPKDSRAKDFKSSSVRPTRWSPARNWSFSSL